MFKPLDFMKFLFLFLVAGGRRFFVVLSVICAAVFLSQAVVEEGLPQKKFDKDVTLAIVGSSFEA